LAAKQCEHAAQALSAVKSGEKAVAVFKAAGISSIGALLQWRPSFSTSTLDRADVVALDEALTKAQTEDEPGKPARARWPSSDQTEVLSAIIARAQSLQDLERLAVQAAVAAPEQAAAPVASATAHAAASGTVAPASAAAAAAKVGEKQYKLATEVFNKEYLASTRVKYEVVGKLHNAYNEITPMAYALGDFSMQLQLRSGKADTIEFAGRVWANEDGADKKLQVQTWEQMEQQMKRRAEAKAVAGCFDVDAAAKARGEKPPAGEQVRPGSNLRFVAELLHAPI
jgi:hypothetical protein